MAVTFDPALATPKDRIRQRIGDTTIARAKIQDETIAYYLAQGFSELRAAQRLCLDLAAQYAPLGDITIDRQLSKTSQIYDHYISLAAAIGEELAKATVASSATPMMVVGGIGDRRGPLDCGYQRPGWPWDC